jgi:hypothetical protein
MFLGIARHRPKGEEDSPMNVRKPISRKSSGPGVDREIALALGEMSSVVRRDVGAGPVA